MGNANNKSKKRRKSMVYESSSDIKSRTRTSKNNTDPKEEIIEANTPKKLKCLSDNKLIKVSYENNHEENLPNSIDTNFSSTKSNTNIEEEEIEENNNESEEDEESDKNEENKDNEFIITKNIKKVFIESKLLTKEKEESTNDSSYENQNEEINNNIEINDNNNTERTLSVSTFDYELNIFRDSGAVRESYISKLISKNIWNPGIKPKVHNSLIIFDWDDTLLPTSFLTPKGTFSEEVQLSPSDLEKMQQIEDYVYIILKECIEKGDVYIITNAGTNWVQYSANLFYPKISELLKKIKIISARGEYEKSFPGNLRQWKIQAFLNLLKDVNNKLVTNIICVGDSLFEIEAGRILASNFKEAYIKTIKFREAPKLDELLKQLKLVSQQFGSIYSSIKNLTIRIERKKKEK